jgi:hypothetical protein
MGGCTYEDLKAFVEDQRRSQNLVPGPVQIINSDLIIDELQLRDWRRMARLPWC